MAALKILGGCPGAHFESVVGVDNGIRLAKEQIDHGLEHKDRFLSSRCESMEGAREILCGSQKCS